MRGVTREKKRRGGEEIFSLLLLCRFLLTRAVVAWRADTSRPSLSSAAERPSFILISACVHFRN